MLARPIRIFAILGMLPLLASSAIADPCGMVPPIYTGPIQPIKRVGLQETYVFYKDGVETFVIRPGYEGKVDEFGMLIPFPKPPALRKVPDHVFPHLAAAIDPPEVVVHVQQFLIRQNARFFNAPTNQAAPASEAPLEYHAVRVVRQEAVGMYEVAVLEAGSPAALKKWMDEHGYKYPDGMDQACEEYVKDRWCFVAVKTKVGAKGNVDPQPAQRKVDPQLPDGSTFDGHVQAMGFRFPTDELVVPMRLAAFNEGELRNIVYLLTDSPQKIRSIPEEYVVRQLTGEELLRNVTQPLPLRVIGGDLADVPDWRKKSLPDERKPGPRNGAARDLFASDLLAISTGKLSLDHEEKEKELLAIGERMGLRGADVDKLHEQFLTKEREAAVASAIKDLAGMSLTVVDGDFPREVLARKNLKFAEYKMPARRNKAEHYDTKIKAPSGKKQGVLKLGTIDWNSRSQDAAPNLDQEVAGSFQWFGSAGLMVAGLSLLVVGLLWNVRRRTLLMVVAAAALLPNIASADPCGMVPPIYTGEGQPITRVGEQMTFVFYKDGVETFVIRPGFEGKVDEFGMLIPFPQPPALRKVPDHIFGHIAAAIDPPEVVIDVNPPPVPSAPAVAFGAVDPLSDAVEEDLAFIAPNVVRVLKKEAVGMYEVAVLAAGSAEALKKWMDEHGYKYPKGMDDVCEEYVEERWCFVAVKTKVGQKDGVEPKPAQRNVDSKLPDGSTFDGNVQAMGFRFRTKQLVVPMRLSAFNAGELRNIVYLLTDKPQKIKAIPEEYVVRQISGPDLHRNVMGPLPLRIIGGTEADLKEWHLRDLANRRNPEPKNGAARDLFAGDLLAVSTGELSLQHEEKEKELLAIGERLGLRGKEIDAMHETSLAEMRQDIVKQGIGDLTEMSLTVIDGDFPREVLGKHNLNFAEYHMPARRNKAENYDAKTKAPAGPKQGVLKLGAIDWESRSPAPSGQDLQKDVAGSLRSLGSASLLFAGLSLLAIGLLWNVRRRALLMVAAAATLLPNIASADPCGMVPPIYTGEGQPITRVGEQMTFVFYKDGVETFVIRPGFEGKVDEFGMLIPFPQPPALRKVPDHIFGHIAAAIDPPEVVIDVNPPPPAPRAAAFAFDAAAAPDVDDAFGFVPPDAVRVLKKEAVGMYEVAVLAAGSAEALKKWMDEHGYKYPEGMDDVCEEYVEERWCFVAVKTKVGQKDGVEPKPAQRNVDSKLPDGSTFDGNVQAMGFRFRTKQLVVPMRLSAFNAGELRNIVYLLTDKPQKIKAIPEEYVVRQISGPDLHRNVMGPLPLRIIGGTEADLKEWHLRDLANRRNPEPKNGAARDLFAGDLLAVSTGELSLQHEEKEKELLAIGERLGLRGKEIDAMHETSLAEMRQDIVKQGIGDLTEMSLTVIDGDFPREVLGKHNLNFAEYHMPARRNKAAHYDATAKAPSASRQNGVLIRGELKAAPDKPAKEIAPQPPAPVGAILPAAGLFAGIALLCAGLLLPRTKQ